MQLCELGPAAALLAAVLAALIYGLRVPLTLTGSPAAACYYFDWAPWSLFLDVALVGGYLALAAWLLRLLGLRGPRTRAVGTAVVAGLLTFVLWRVTVAHWPLELDSGWWVRFCHEAGAGMVLWDIVAVTVAGLAMQRLGGQD